MQKTGRRATLHPMQRGFSLVELSIVLVILGLLTGGILAGQSLIRAAELRSVVADFNRYLSATQTFREKYLSIPGDFTRATQFWGRQTNTADCVTNSSASVNSAGSCDGNGDASIGSAGAVSQSGEGFQFWRQLALAGLIEGNYTGIASSTAVNQSIVGTNVPGSRISTAGWTVSGGTMGDSNNFNLNYNWGFIFGAQTSTNSTGGVILKPEEAWGIDVKMDDGKPAYGRAIAVMYATCTNAADMNDYAATYLLTSSSIGCSMRFRNLF